MATYKVWIKYHTWNHHHIVYTATCVEADSCEEALKLAETDEDMEAYRAQEMKDE